MENKPGSREVYNFRTDERFLKLRRIMDQYLSRYSSLVVYVQPAMMVCYC